MAHRAQQTRDGLTESWASMGDGAESVELTSDEEELITQSRSMPKTNLTASRAEHLNEALGRRSPQQNGMPKSMRASRTSAVDDTPRAHIARPRKREPTDFFMPTLDHTSSHEMSLVEGTNRQARADRYDAQKQPKQRRPLGRSKVESDQNMFELVWINFLAPLLAYAFQVLGIAARFAKPIIAYALVIYLLVGGLIITRNLVFSSVTSALTPICKIPGSGMLLPFCATVHFTEEHGDPEFDKLISTQSAFEEIMTTSAESASLPMDMKRSEASIRDLRHVVEYSALPSRNELVFEFGGFIETARQASGDLAKYNSRIGRAVDRILSTNRWTLQILEGVEASKADRGSLSTFVTGWLNIFAPFQGAPAKLTRDILYDQYIRHTSAVEEQIQGLIMEAQALLMVLQNLDDRLDLIASIATRDGIKVQDGKDELFALLWTKLGGNRSSVSKVQRQLAVLKEVGAYRKLAFAHVSTTIIKLQTIAASLEDLRERVARPEVLGVGGPGGVTREEIPLEMHIGEIMMGVERLENVREEGKQIEGQRIRNILDRDERKGIDG
ncbi:hypothetical protein KVT40_001785 [Elsinoe batatas]|uniref:Uncharacterized protein n=1 Tax=Elsinoe batatas TaxID=2601811 RepID=A0A8K0PHL2_9PEZI|nr:hypothetical protein KVT40_001785 [Elsinoe batatas]